MAFLRLTLFVAASALATCLGLPRTASACTVAPQFTNYETQTQSSDQVAPTLVSASIEIERSENPGSFGADCSGLGHFHVRVNASDDQTPAADLGFDLSVVDGTLPFKFPSQYVQSFQEPSEDFSTWFSDDGSDFAATVEVRVVDRAGNVSDPIDVRVTSEEPGCGCSMVGTKGAGASGWVGALLILSFVRRRLTAGPVPGALEQPGAGSSTPETT